MRRYFISGIHKASDAGVMERDLCDYARRIYLNVIASEDGIIKIVEHIKREQDRIIAEKPRRNAVSVGFTVNTIVPGAWISIGTSTMSLTLVQGEIA